MIDETPFLNTSFLMEIFRWVDVLNTSRDAKPQEVRRKTLYAFIPVDSVDVILDI